MTSYSSKHEKSVEEEVNSYLRVAMLDISFMQQTFEKTILNWESTLNMMESFWLFFYKLLLQNELMVYTWYNIGDLQYFSLLRQLWWPTDLEVKP